MTATDDPFGYRERINEEAQRTLDQLRVTLNERMAALEDKARRATDPDDEFLCGFEYATYRDVLSLLGPEPAWWTDPEDGSPF